MLIDQTQAVAFARGQSAESINPLVQVAPPRPRANCSVTGASRKGRSTLWQV
jgi:hypothetical protein